MVKIKSIRGLAIFMYIVVTLLCMTLTFILMQPYILYKMNPLIESIQADTAVTFRDLHQKTELSNEEISKMVSNFICIAEMTDRESLLETGATPEMLKSAEDGEAVYLPRKASTIIYVSGEYIIISTKSSSETSGLDIEVMTIAVAMTIGIVIIIFGTKHAIIPITKLSEAVSEVAKGNFDVSLGNKYQGEIGELYDNFNKMTAELKNIEFLRKDFVNSVSHEFKTPIASIHGFAHMLRDKNNTPEEQEEFTNIILEESDRLSKLSMNLLRLTKLENQQLVKKNTAFSLDEQLRSTILILEPEWEKKSIDFDISMSEIKILGDEDLLKQVWINLLGNAIRFSPEGGSIEVKLFRAENKVKVMISDHGIGMDEETRSRIFERFYQGDKEHSDKGNGLGLTIVKQILNLCGGSIYVDSAVGVGSTFTVVLPYEE